MRAIILAAGKGTRLQSEQFNLPKVLRSLCGKPLIGHVLSNTSFIAPEDTAIVVGYMREKVMEAVGGEYKFAVQAEQKGTGHAVLSAEEYFADYDGDVIILFGDMPMFKKEHYEGVIKKHQESGADLTILTAIIDAPLPYGRIIRDENGNVKDIVEHKDCTEEQRKINELNVGIFVAKSRLLFEALHKIGNNNAQGEYYLTDVPKILISEGKTVTSHAIFDEVAIVGVNTVEDLEFCEKHMKDRK
ncbi:MAG: NTP transferase domain-containing protein [Clostridia bacterium]|nr:NTP transferase domain-containing protein [Clostridia bacterium]